MRILTQTPWWRRALRSLGRRLFRLAENNEDPRFAHNGEEWLLRELLAAHARAGNPRPFVLFDVGANVGDYSREALRLADATGCALEIHLFEPSPLCLEKLQRGFAAEPRVRIVAGAAAAAPGEAMLHDGGLGSTLASLVARDVLSGDQAAAVRVRLLALGDYLAEQRMTGIDLLKLDVEGSELAALRGLGAWLRPATIRMIQFEYGGAALDAGTPLRELQALLVKCGYRVAKLLPSALEVRDYAIWMEHYAYANYVALAPERSP